MKNCIILLLLLVSSTCFSQNFSGEAIYQSKKQTKYSVNSTDERERRKAIRLSRLHEKEMRLVFNENKSFYKEIQTLKAKENAAYKAGALSLGGFSSNGIYKNLQDTAYVEQREFLGKLLLVKDKLPKIDWTLTKESKTIGKYVVIKATAPVSIDVDNFKVPKKNVKGTFIATAWFTPQIPVSQGPELFYGLPGLILEMHILDTTILCTKITLNKEVDKNLKPSTGGQEVTLEEYNNIVFKKLEERKN